MDRLVAIALIFVVSFSSFAQNKKNSWSWSLGMGFFTWPQTALLNASDNRTESLNLQNNGGLLSAQVEQTFDLWNLVFNFGLGYGIARAKSVGTTIDYSYSGSPVIPIKFSIEGIRSFTQYARVGFGFETLYHTIQLPVPTGPGITYSFNYGTSSIRFNLALIFEWQFVSKWYINQKLLTGLSPDLLPGWQISLRKAY